MKNKPLFKSILLATALVAGSAAQAGETVKVGVVGPHQEQWEHIRDVLAPKGIDIEIVRFADYVLPNRSLNDGETDLNSFQTIIFLKNANKEFGFKLVPIGDTVICPLGLFSKRYKSPSEFKRGDRVAIPNDPTQGGRALKLLEAAGLIKVNPDKGFLPAVRDITENPLDLDIYEVDAANTAGLLPDVAGSVINSNYAVDNGLVPAKDAIFLEQVSPGDSGNPYVNVIAAREDQKDRPVFAEIVKAYQSADTAKVIHEAFKGAQIPVFKY